MKRHRILLAWKVSYKENVVDFCWRLSCSLKQWKAAIFVNRSVARCLKWKGDLCWFLRCSLFKGKIRRFLRLYLASPLLSLKRKRLRLCWLLCCSLSLIMKRRRFFLGSLLPSPLLPCQYEKAPINAGFSIALSLKEKEKAPISSILLSLTVKATIFTCPLRWSI